MWLIVRHMYVLRRAYVPTPLTGGARAPCPQTRLPQVVRVPEEALPEVEETATPFGLTPEQHAKLKQLWYERGHYASRDRMWVEDDSRICPNAPLQGLQMLYQTAQRLVRQ